MNFDPYDLLYLGAGMMFTGILAFVLCAIGDAALPMIGRLKRRLQPDPKYLSWYRDGRPWMNDKKWLADSWDGEGHVYVRERDKATRYDRETALKLTPKYDGSGGIEKRAGIERA